MSKQANTKLIGGFVVGAMVLVVAALLLFGSGRLFSKSKKFVLFFEDSVSGLSVGAPVDLRGVKIGSVTDIKVILDKENLSLRIPVIIEIDPRKVSFSGTDSDLQKLTQAEGGKTLLQLLIKRGLRAQLVMQSAITGLLGIHLDFYPNKPVRLVGAEPGYPEIPTVESRLTELANAIQNLPLAEIADKLLKTLDSADRLINSPDIRDTVVRLDQTIKAAQALIVNLDGQITPLSTSAKVSLEQARKAFANAAKLAGKLNTEVPRAVAQMNETLKTASATMRGANEAIEGIAGDDSPLRLQLEKTLNELALAARSFRVLTDYIENHPEALLRGKGR